MYVLLLVAAVVIALADSTQGCTDLIAIADIVLSFDSHALHGFSNYSNDYDACWVITGPEDYVLQMWTDDQFSLEYDLFCDFDFLKISCGEDGEDGLIGKYCGNDGIDEDDPVYSDDNSVRVKFSTDFYITSYGFTFYYKAVTSDTGNGGDCVLDSLEDIKKVSSRGYNIWIWVGSAIFLLLLIIVIVVCCVCVCKMCANSRGGGQVHPPPTNRSFVAVVATSHH